MNPVNGNICFSFIFIMFSCQLLFGILHEQKLDLVDSRLGQTQSTSERTAQNNSAGTSFLRQSFAFYDLLTT